MTLVSRTLMYSFVRIICFLGRTTNSGIASELNEAQIVTPGSQNEILNKWPLIGRQWDQFNSHWSKQKPQTHTFRNPHSLVKVLLLVAVLAPFTSYEDTLSCLWSNPDRGLNKKKQKFNGTKMSLIWQPPPSADLTTFYHGFCPDSTLKKQFLKILTSSVKRTRSHCWGLHAWYWWQNWSRSFRMRSVKIGFRAGRQARNRSSTRMALLMVVMLKWRREKNLFLIIFAVTNGSRSTARFNVNKFARLTVVGLPVEELLTQFFGVSLTKNYTWKPISNNNHTRKSSNIIRLPKTN